MTVLHTESHSSPKRIAWIENANFLGGAELFSLDMLGFAESSVSYPLDIHVYSSESAGHEFSEKLANCSKSFSSQFSLHHKPFFLPRLLPFSFGKIWDAFSSMHALVDAVKKYKYDTVYCNTVRGAIITGLAQFFFPKKTKTVFMAHDYTFPSFLVRFLLSRFNQVLACSYGVKQYLVQHGLKAWKAEVIENGVDPKRFESLPDITPPLFSVGIIGRISSWKGQMTVLRTAQWLLENASDYPFQFSFYGKSSPKKEDQEYEKSLHAFVKEHNLSNVVFHGFTPVEEALAPHHIIVHPAEEKEPFGRVPLESAIAGKVVCISDMGTPAEIFTDAKTAFFFSAGDFKSLAEKLIIIAHNKEKALEVAEKGKALVLEKFNLSVLAKKFWKYVV